MAQTFTCNYVHIVFSTKQRQASIKNKTKLWAYMAGITRNIKVEPCAIGGMQDHCHMLLSWKGDFSIPKIVNLVKSNSSKWMNEHGSRFSWQNGYAAFSVSASNVRQVVTYIENQEEHH